MFEVSIHTRLERQKEVYTRRRGAFLSLKVACSEDARSGIQGLTPLARLELGSNLVTPQTPRQWSWLEGTETVEGKEVHRSEYGRHSGVKTQATKTDH